VLILWSAGRIAEFVRVPPVHREVGGGTEGEAMSRRKNQRALKKGSLSRMSDCGGAAGGRRDRAKSRLLPSLASRPSDRCVDGEALAAEIASLVEVAKTRHNT